MDKHDKRHNPKHATKRDSKHPDRPTQADVPGHTITQPAASDDLAPIARAKEGTKRRPFSGN
jgi:hypothetical protein